jgi:hypothetical protein
VNGIGEKIINYKILLDKLIFLDYVYSLSGKKWEKVV